MPTTPITPFPEGSGLANTGHGLNLPNDSSSIQKVIFCPAGFSIDQQSDAVSEVFWKGSPAGTPTIGLIKKPKQERCFPFQKAVDITPAKEEDIYDDTAMGGKIFVREGKIIFTLILNVNKESYKNLRKFNNQKGSIILGSFNNKLLAWSDDGTTIKAFDVDLFRVGTQTLSDSKKFSQTPVMIVLADSHQWSDYGYELPVTDWLFPNLDGVYDVNIAVEGVISGTSATVRVWRKGFAATDERGWINALLPADFKLVKTTGVTITTAAYDDNTGLYTLVYATQTGNLTLALQPCGSISFVEPAIEFNDTPIPFVIP